MVLNDKINKNNVNVNIVVYVLYFKTGYISRYSMVMSLYVIKINPCLALTLL